MEDFENLALAFEHLVKDYAGYDCQCAGVFRSLSNVDISKSDELRKAKELGQVIAYLEIALDNLKKKYEDKEPVYKLLTSMTDKLSTATTSETIDDIIEDLYKKKIIF